MDIDLHTHTHFSDGALEPSALVARAIGRGVATLAITDHDTVDAYRGLELPPGRIRIVAGIEFSTQWQGAGIHVLGLGIDPSSDAIAEGVRRQGEARLERARRIGEILGRMGVADAFDGARRLAGGGYIGRPHFARYLVACGKARSLQAAFRKYVGDGKPGDVTHHWAELDQVVQWIRGAGGVAVLAHPLKYKMTRARLKRLLTAFRAAGGEGMEVVSGQQDPKQTQGMAGLCAEMDLLASCGSDFHAPDSRWAELGAFAPLPAGVTPVWERFG